MWFLIKAAFWFTLVLVLLPLANPDDAARSDVGSQVQVGATLAAATSAVDDLTGLCSRRPQVCETGGRTLAALGAQARNGALIAYRFLDSRFGDDRSAVTTGSVPPVSQSTPASPAAQAPAEAAIPVPMAAPRATQGAREPAVSQSQPAVLPKPYSPPLP